jgi:hypothetical protein
MRNGPYDDLHDDFREKLKWLFDAAFGRVTATAQAIGKQIHDFGTIKRLLGK